MFESLVFWAMTTMIRLWVNRYMDQFEHFKFKCVFGHTTYISMSYFDEYPHVFVDLDTGQIG